LRLERPATDGWLHWRFPALYINQSSGDPRYQKHTAADNLSAIDFALLKGRLDDLVSWLLAIDSVL